MTSGNHPESLSRFFSFILSVSPPSIAPSIPLTIFSHTHTYTRRDVKNMTKFEASGLAAVRGRFYVVFDSSFALGSLDDEFAFRGQYNTLIGEPGTLDSQFEGIAYVPENDTFLLLHEALPSSSSSSSDDDDDDNNNNNKENDDEPYTPFITEIQINGDGSDYKVLSQCAIDFVLTHANKGQTRKKLFIFKS